MCTIQYFVRMLYYTICCTSVVLYNMLYECYTIQYVVRMLYYTICCTDVLLYNILYEYCTIQYVVRMLYYTICCTIHATISPANCVRGGAAGAV